MVTGGAGFIGSNFVRYYLNKHSEDEIINLDKLTYAGNLENLRGIDERHTFIKGNICDRKEVERIVSDDVDVILNFAAETHVDRSIINPHSFIMTNVYGTYVLLEAARSFDVKKFVQISTDEVYGSIEKGSFKEENPLDPSSPYSASKAGADHLVNSYHVTYNLPTLITRSSNNYGPRQHPEKFMSKLITNALQNKPLPVYGDGKNVRDWIYVEDNCESIDLVFRKGKSGETYNMGAGNEKTNLEVSRNILEELKRPETLIAFVEDRPGHDLRYSVDCAKTKRLGWRPGTGFSDGLKRTIEWYKMNEWFWGGV